MQALAETASLTLDQLSRLRCRIECPPPNPELYKFDATLFLDESGWGETSPLYTDRERLLTIPLSADGLLQQGTVLRNTAVAAGVAICTYKLICLYLCLPGAGKRDAQGREWDVVMGILPIRAECDTPLLVPSPTPSSPHHRNRHRE